MKTFEITIRRKQHDAWPVVAERNETGTFLPVQVEGTLQLDLVELRTQVNPKQHGTVLGKALFRDEVRDAFVEASADDADGELHVFLVVEDPELRGLRWGQLCAPLDGAWRLLALDQRVPYSLYLPSLSDRRFPPIGRDDLRALILVASPAGLDRYGMTHFEVGPTVADARSALGTIPCEVLAEVGGAVGPPTLDALCDRLTDERFTLLHVTCHGGLSRGTTDQEREPILYLANKHGEVDAIPASRVIDRLANLRGARGLPHLTFLSSCFSANESTEASWSGLGQRLVRDLGMPAVIGMSDAISIETANRLTGQFYERLWEHGKVDLAMVEACAGLAGLSDVTVPILLSRLGGRPLFSLAMDTTLSPGDVEYGLERLKVLAEERAPTLREQVAACASTLTSTLGKADAALDQPAIKARTDALTAANVLGQEIAEISFNDLALRKAPPPYDSRCPFRGLYPFRPEDRSFFFGRKRLVEALLSRLGKHPFLPVLGPSGSGKSSLVLAGLIPALQEREPGLELVYLTPGADPLAALDSKVQAIGTTPSVVVVDQLEEMFTLCHDGARRKAFMARLLEVAACWRVILTMRADFWDECANYGDFTRAMQDHQELIGPLDGTELRDAIELQAKAVGLSFEAGLSDTILADVQGEPGAMPLLQHALFELWNRRRGRWLRASEYVAIGRVQGAIATSAETLYETLTPGDKARAEAILLRLTRLDAEPSPSERPRDTRRQVRIEDLSGDGGDPAATRALVTRLASARLLVTGHDQLSRSGTVQVAHEALIRHWPRLRGWLDRDREFLLWRQRLGANLDDWKHNRRDEGDLLRGLALLTAERWLLDRPGDLNTDEITYIRASKADASRRQRTYIAAGAAVLFLMSTLAVVATIQWYAASANEARALDSEARALTSEEEAIQARDFAIAAREVADEATEEARFQAADAKAQRAEAERQTAEAERQRAEAVSARNDAEERRKVALARQLAADSELLRRQRGGLLELSTLLAIESFQHSPTLGGDLALRGALDLLPRQMSTANVGGRPLKLSPDGRLVLTSVEAPRSQQSGAQASGPTTTYEIREVQSGRLVSRLAGTRYPSDQVFSPDGAMLVAVDSGDTILAWDTASGGLLPGLPEIPGDRFALSPDGRYLATTTWRQRGPETEHRTIVWDTAGWSQVAQIRHSHQVATLAFSPDQTYLATASGFFGIEGPGEDDVARLWEIARCRDGCQESARLAHDGEVNRIVFSGDGRRLATASSDRHIRLWERRPDGSLELIRKIEYRHPLLDVILSRDGRYVAGRTWVIGGQRGGDYSEPIQVYEAQTGRQVTYVVSDSYLLDASFTPDSAHLLTVSVDNLARLWEVEGGREVVRVPADRGGPRPSFTPDGARLLTGDQDGNVQTWEPQGGHERLWLRQSQVAVAIAFSHDGQSVAGGSYDGTARVWSLGTGQEIACVNHRDGPCAEASGDYRGDDAQQVIAVAISPDGQRLATGSRDNTARVRALAGGPETVLRHPLNVNAVAFSPDGQRLATGGEDARVRIWDLSTGTEIVSLAHNGNVTAVAFHRDGNLLATTGGRSLGGATSDNAVRIWDLTSRQEVARMPHTDSVWSVAFNPDGSSLASASGDGVVRFWAVPGFHKLDRELRHESSVNTVAFSPDGLLVATAHDTIASVWSLAAGQVISQVAYGEMNLVGARRSGPVRAVAFGHDGRTLATAGWDGIRVWTRPTQELITEACRRLTRNLREPEWKTYLPGEGPRKTCQNLS